MPRKDRKNRRQEASQWRVVTDCTPKDVPEWRGIIPEAQSVREPIEYFRELYDHEILEHIVSQSNLYATQNNPSKPLKLDKNELERFLGSLYLMSLVKLTKTRLYWSGKFELHSISEYFSRSRWEQIKRFLHFNDNSAEPERNDSNRDKLYKVRPLIEHLVLKFRKIPKSQCCCIDEMIVPFKGSSSLKQYTPSKPHKWSFKIFALCDVSGLLYDFHIYDGPLKPVEGEPDLGASSNIVLQLAKTIPVGANYLLFYDNWFTAPHLMANLAKKQIYSLGTVRQNRLKGVTSVLPSDKEMMKKARGSYVEAVASYDGEELRALKWYDTRCVTLLTSFSSASPLSKCNRYDKKARKDIEIQCPKMIEVYNKEIGGVDLMDSLVALYRIQIRSHKFYHKIFFFLLDVGLVNAWLLYRRDADSLRIPKAAQHQLQSFKLLVANSLLKQHKEIAQKPVGRPSASSVGNAHIAKKRRGHNTHDIPEENIRKDSVGHWPMIMQGTERPRCKMPNCNGRTNVYCNKCNVNLCFKKEKNCFYMFHHI
ncbi:UNVERIFIED_CONTAM: hypothetical protein GTU68_003642 [Idotea baltica]|nr:hypothetical protein [Idotea baltica]